MDKFERNHYALGVHAYRIYVSVDEADEYPLPFPELCQRYELRSGLFSVDHRYMNRLEDSLEADKLTEEQFWQHIASNRLSRSTLPTNIEEFMKIQPKYRDILPGDDAVSVKDITFDLAELKVMQSILLDMLKATSDAERAKAAMAGNADGQVDVPDTYRHNELSKKLEYFISEFDGEG